MASCRSLCPSSPCNHNARCTALLSASVKERIKEKCEQFGENFYLDGGFFISLESRGVLSTAEKNRIQRQDASTTEQCSMILNRLAHKTWGHLRQFCRILHDRDEGYLLREVFGLTEDADIIETFNLNACENITTRQPKVLIDNVREHLQRHYRQRFYNVEVLGSKPFDLAKHYINVDLTEESGIVDETQSKHLSEDQMFRADGLRVEFQDDYKKVLVQGLTGCGKSSLCLHTAGAWAMRKGDEGSSFLDRFKLVILLEANVVLRSGVKGAIKQLLPRREGCLRTVWHYLETHGEKCLIIVDDIDTILMHAATDIVQNVLEIVHDKLFYGCTLLATSCRELEQDSLKCFERKLSHKGFHQEQGSQFIEKYFGSNTASLQSLQNFLRGCSDDKRSVDEIIRRPLWNLCLCQLWELSGYVKTRKLNVTILYSRMEEAIVGGKPTSSEEEEMRQLYSLCLYAVMHHIDFFEKPLLRQFNIRKKSVAFRFLTKRTFVTDDFREDFRFVIPHKTQLYYFAAKAVKAQNCAQSQWILLNILLNTKSFSEITVFLSGLLNIPNLFDLIFMHILFNQRVNIDQIRGDCKDSIVQVQNMVSDLYKESSEYLTDTTDKRRQTTLINQKKLHEESFSQHVQNTKRMSSVIKRMARDIRYSICPKCFTNLFHLVLSQYRQIVWLLRCFFEYSAQDKRPESDLMKKLDQFHKKEIFLGRTDSPYDFLVSEFSNNGRCFLTIPYAEEVSHLKILADVLDHHLKRNKQMTDLNVCFGVAQTTITKYSPTRNKAGAIAKEVKAILLKLHEKGLTDISLTGLHPEYAAQILPASVPGMLDKLTVSYFSPTSKWVVLLKQLSCLAVNELHLESLDMEGTQLLGDILKSGPGFCENVVLLHLGHRTRVEREVFLQYIDSGPTSINFEHLVLNESTFSEVTLDVDPVTTNRNLYISYGEGAYRTDGLLPSSVHLEKLRVRDIVSPENLNSLLKEVSQNGVKIADLQIDHLYMSSFILRELSEHRENIAHHVQQIKIRHGTYSPDDIREFLMWQACSPGPLIILDSPIIHGYNMEAIQIKKDPTNERMITLELCFISNSQRYVPCLPAGIAFGQVSFAGLAMDNTTVWQDILQDVSDCPISQLKFHSKTCVNGDPCVRVLLKDAHRLSNIRELVLQNVHFFETETAEFLKVSRELPFSLQTSEIGQMQFDSVSFETLPDTELQTVTARCKYPQDFTDLLPPSHNVCRLVVKLHSDYSQSVCSESSVPNSPLNTSYSERSFPSRSRKIHSPSSIPDSFRSSSTSPSSASSSSEQDNSPPRYNSQRSNCTGSCHNSAGTENLSRGTQADSANTLMKELDKGFIRIVELDLTECESVACEDVVQALVDHKEILERCVGELQLRISEVNKNLFEQSLLSVCTIFIA